MKHPFLQNYKSILLYMVAWILITGIHATILFFFNALPLTIVLLDSIVFNVLFAFLSLSIWYYVKYNRPDRSKTFNFIIYQISALVFVLLIWIGASYSILQSVVSYHGYSEFLNGSLHWRAISGTLYYFIVILIYYLMINTQDLQEKTIMEGQLRQYLKESELNVLKSQINPHFLFNSLNSISSLTITDPPAAQEMIIRLSDFLRYTVSIQDRQMSSLKEEIANIRAYLDIEKIRFGNKLDHEWIIDENLLNHQLPSLILQPIYENAVKHGVYESTQKINISTKCYIEHGMLHITIVNNIDPSGNPRKGAGKGLKNIEDRLRLIYQANGLIQSAKTDQSFTVTLYIPLQPQKIKS